MCKQSVVLAMREVASGRRTAGGKPTARSPSMEARWTSSARGCAASTGRSIRHKGLILFRNTRSPETVSRLNQRSRAPRSATICDRRSAFFRVPCGGFRFASSSIRGGRAVLACAATATAATRAPGKDFQTATTLQCLRHRHFLAVWQPLHGDHVAL